MGKRATAPEGWYPDGGVERRWNGRDWTGEVRPLPLADGTPAGWYRQDPALQRWWTGTGWSPALRADDGTVDVARGVGQYVLTVVAMGGSDQTAVDRLMVALRDFPPVRIESLVPRANMTAAGANLVAVVSW